MHKSHSQNQCAGTACSDKTHAHTYKHIYFSVDHLFQPLKSKHSLELNTQCTANVSMLLQFLSCSTSQDLRDNCTLTFPIVQHVPQPAPGHPQWSQAYEPPTDTGKQQSWISFYCSQHHLTLESKVWIKYSKLLPVPQNWPLHTCGRPLQQCA